MRKLLFALLLIISFSSLGLSQVISPELQNVIDRKTDEMISVNIILKSQINLKDLSRRAEGVTDKKVRRDILIDELRLFTEKEQAEIMSILKAEERSSRVSDIRSSWTANYINCSTTSDVIYLLAEHPDVLMIGYNEEKMLLWDEKSSEASPDDEVIENIIKVNADDVWELGVTGEGVVVAVIDSGVNYNHVDLADHLWDGGAQFPHHGYDVYDNDNDPMDNFGHGTHCAGTICGDGTSGTKTGMAPNATLMIVKCVSDEGMGDANNINDGMEWAIEHHADVLSMSLGVPMASIASKTILRRTSVTALELGIVAAVAVGNEGNNELFYPTPDNVRTPGSCPPPWLHPDQANANAGDLSCVIAIGAVDYNDAAAYFSSHGPVTWTATEFGDYAYSPGIGLIRPDVCAPGVDIVSLDFKTTDGFTKMSGTSMATPCAAGVMALLLDKNPNLTPADVSRILETTAHKISPNKNNNTGSGRIDALAAINAIDCGDFKYANHIIVDNENGNDNGNLNAQEQVNLQVSVENTSGETYSNVKAVLRSKRSLVRIDDSIAQVNNISANETFSITEGFTFFVEETANYKTILGFDIYFYDENDALISFVRVPVKVKDNMLNFSSVIVKNDDNNNGILEAGETADLGVVVNNIGNETFISSKCTLSTNNNSVTINTNEISLNPIGSQASETIFFNVTLSNNVDDFFSIPFEVTLENASKTETLPFDYSNKCYVIFELKDSYGDGWDGAALVVKYSDGSAEDAFTVEDGNIVTYTREIGNGVEVSLEWIKGSWDSECSFIVKKENGAVIYSSPESLSAGFLFSWVNDCSFQNNSYTMCDAVQNLDIESEFPVKIKWNTPASGNANYYEVYRDTRFLGTTEELAFNDETATGTFSYEYSVRPVYDECVGYLSTINIEHIDDAVEENLTINADVYPNPSSDDFTIVCNNMTSVSVYNVMGVMIMDAQVNSDRYIVSGLNSGIYFINIKTNDGTVVRKVVKL